MQLLWPLRALIACLAVLAFAVPAHAATTIGALPSESDPINCAPNFEFMQYTAGAGDESYDVPSAGVITSWSTKVAGPGTSARLKVYRPTAAANKWTVFGESPVKPLNVTGLNTANVRISVQPGDRIAIRTGAENGGPCYFPNSGTLDPGYDVFAYQSSPNPFVDPSAGSDVTFASYGARQLVNISAAVEPDADRDGFGDQTQDKCPGSAGPDDGCKPPPPSTTTPIPPVSNPTPIPPVKPVLKVVPKLKRTQHVLRQHGLILSIRPSLVSTITATATVNIPHASAVLRFKRVTKRVAADHTVRLTLKLSKRTLARVRAALARHAKLNAKTVITAKSAGAASVVKRFSIHLKR